MCSDIKVFDWMDGKSHFDRRAKRRMAMTNLAKFLIVEFWTSILKVVFEIYNCVVLNVRDLVVKDLLVRVQRGRVSHPQLRRVVVTLVLKGQLCYPHTEPTSDSTSPRT